MNWKQFKNWLDKNITENNGLLVKVKFEKQNKYGEISTQILTGFCDSLEATLDNNTNCHLFPTFSDDKNFKELFNHQDCHFGKKTSQEKVNEDDYKLLEKMFEEWKLTQNHNINTGNTTMNTRNILLIGRTGSGKSTLANVLMGENRFVESAKSISATKHVEQEVFEVDLDKEGNEKIRYRVIDTIGLGDTKMKPQGVLIRLAEMADWVKEEGLNQILFVTRNRFTKEEIEAYDLLSSIIFDKEVLKYTTVVKTGFPEFEDSEVCDDDRGSLRTENADLAHILEKVNIVYVDNPPLKGRNAETNKEIREESRKRLLTYLAKCRKTYRPSNIDTLDERVKDYKTNEQLLKDKMKELEQARKQQEEEFRIKLADMKEEQKRELRENRRQFEEQIHKTKVESDEKLRTTVNDLEDKQKKKIDDMEQKNKEQLRQSEEKGKQEIKKVEEAVEEQKKARQEDLKKSREEMNRLQGELNKKNDNTEMFMKMMEDNRKDEQARQDRAEDQRREFEQKKLDADNKWRKDQADKEEARRKEDKAAEEKRQAKEDAIREQLRKEESERRYQQEEVQRLKNRGWWDRLRNN